MVKTSLEIIVTLLPFAVLFSAFLIFKLDAFRASLSAWVFELVVALAYYHMALVKSIEASLWGNLTMWSAFLVLYTGQIFGQAYRNTGLLQILLESIQSILPSWDQEGQAVALVTIVGGFIGAFNGFATYPVTIPGLVDLGIRRHQRGDELPGLFFLDASVQQPFHCAEHFERRQQGGGGGYRARRRVC